MLIDFIASEQPDFIKIASVLAAIRNEQNNKAGLRYRLIYTGHHNDKIINPAFFGLFNIPHPNINLETGNELSGIAQTATVMVRYEKVISLSKPHLVLVVGDSHASMACAVTAKKSFNIPIGHIEAGLRSHDTSMQEEINRTITDSFADYYFTTSHNANKNLRHSGVPDERIFIVGNTRIDSFIRLHTRFHYPFFWNKLKLKPQGYFLVCLHRERNIKLPVLKEILSSVINSSQKLPVIFPASQQVIKLISATGIKSPNLVVTGLLDYLQYGFLLQFAKAVITDYGGVQEEASMVHTPCMTISDNMERMETFVTGTNMLISKAAILHSAFEKLYMGKWKKGNIPYMWDGKSSERVLAVLRNLNLNRSK